MYDIHIYGYDRGNNYFGMSNNRTLSRLWTYLLLLMLLLALVLLSSPLWLPTSTTAFLHNSLMDAGITTTSGTIEWHGLGEIEALDWNGFYSRKQGRIEFSIPSVKLSYKHWPPQITTILIPTLEIKGMGLIATGSLREGKPTQQHIRLEQVQLDVALISPTSSGVKFQTHLRLPRLEASLSKDARIALSLSGTITGLARLGHTTLNANTAGKLLNYPLDFSLIADSKHAKTRSGWKAEFTINPVKFSSPKFTLAKLPLPYDLPFDIRGGSLSGSYRMSSLGHTGPTQELELAGDSLLVTVGSSTITGLTTNASLALAPKLHSITPIVFKASKIDCGFPLTELTGEISFSNQQDRTIIHLSQLHGETMGGTIELKPLSIPMIERTNTTAMLAISDLSLSKLTEFYPQKVIAATGLLSGYLPLKFTPEGLSIHKGNLYASGPGTIHYYGSTTDGSKQENSLNFALQALQNLNYHELAVTIDYLENGELTLTARINGNNPDLKTKRPLDVNITLQENIPALLETLRLGRRVESEVGAALQKVVANKGE